MKKETIVQSLSALFEVPMLNEHLSTLYNDQIWNDMDWPRKVIDHIQDMSASKKFTALVPSLVAVVDFDVEDGFDWSGYARVAGEYEPILNRDRYIYRFVSPKNIDFYLVKGQDSWCLQINHNSRMVTVMDAPATKDNEYRTALMPSELGWRITETGVNVPLRVRLVPRNADERERMDSEVSGDDDENDNSSMVAEGSDDGYLST